MNIENTADTQRIPHMKAYTTDDGLPKSQVGGLAKGHSNSIYATEIGTCHNSNLVFLFCWSSGLKKVMEKYVNTAD